MTRHPEQSTPDDDFLRQYAHPPRPAFADALHARLQQIAVRPIRPRAALRLAWGAGALALTLAVVLTLSPAARAEATALLRLIGGIAVEEVAENPPLTPTEQVSETPRVPWAVAQERMGIALPTVLPPGYVLQPEASLLEDPQFTIATFSWRGEGGGLLQFSAKRGGAEIDFAQRIGLESAEAIQVNGAPAALIRGAWDGTGWQRDGTLTISWRRGDDVYDLVAFNATYEEATPLTVAELVQVAESLP